MPIDFVSVQSSTVDKTGYDAEFHELHVIFRSNWHYIYSNVPEPVYARFLAAPSKGTFVNQVLKRGPFPYRRVA